jgi:putative RecB family exonuclease
VPTYSHSRLETYRNCPRQYKIQYVDKIKAETESVEAFMGSMVHDALERLYRDVRMTKLPAKDDLIGYFDKIWDENWHEGITIVRKQYSPDNYRQVGRKCLAEYYDRHHPFNETRTVALEHLVFFPLDEGEQCWVRGVVDRIAVAADGTYEIHDYKTSGTLRTQGEVDKDPQLALYQIALERMWKDVRRVELVWHYLAFGKELRSARSAEELEQLKRDTLKVIDAIDKETEFRPHESGLCDWCAYTEYCPAKKHILLTDSLPPNEYLKEPGVTLVNAYADLHRRKTELEEEIEKVKAALVDYARRNQVEVIKGSGHRVIVKFYRGLAFPGKDEPERRALEDLVRASGLWERVSSFSPISLAKLVEAGALDDELTRKIAAMGKEEERPWVKLSGLGR